MKSETVITIEAEKYAINKLTWDIEKGEWKKMTGENLKKRREKLGLSQASLAKLLGTTQTTISRNELGLSPIQNPTMLDLALQTLERKNETKSK